MYTFISVLIYIVCFLVILLVLVQNSKGGGLASSFSSSNQVMGVRKTTDFLEKGTWFLATALVVLCISATAFLPRQGNQAKSAIEQQIQGVQDPSALPMFPQSVPQKGSDSAKTK
ncbi:MAG: preprotein translocase subunit SecG [Bacteroidetes bacterium]|nr:preprotein translocase subunit SecG [Bacteroidota bacterium]MCL6101063.1 preprotein translocase subunit SecG [Bacteroidota bacterium]